MRRLLPCIVCLALLMPASCKDKAEKAPRKQAAAPSGSDMESVNRYMSERDRDIVEGYAKRHKLSLLFSEKGYYYHVYEQGTGANATQGRRVELAGTVELINGSVCYVYTREHPKSFVVGKSSEISGLHTVLPDYGEGSKLLLIFPPHLAYGLLGDGDKIPARSLVVMNIELLKVEY